MTIFDRLFGKKRSQVTDRESSSLAPIDKETFIEERDPSALFTQTVEAEDPQGEPGFLEEVLTRDYYAMGKRDGYDDHDPACMEEHLDIIVADFRLVLYKASEEIDHRLDFIKLHLTPKAREIMQEEYSKVQVRHDQLERQKRELTRQTDLAAVGEGLIEKSVRLYRAGFKKGYALWLEEDLLFRGPKIL